MSVIIMKSSENSILSFIKLCITLFLQVQVTISAESRTFDYYQNTNPSIGLSRSSISYKGEKSVLVCASQCSSQSHCGSFLWDSKNRTCITGTWPAHSGDIILPSGSQKLYQRPNKCRFDLAYEMQSYGSIQRCVYLSKDRLKYQSARNKCRQLGGRLLKSNSLDIIKMMTVKAKDEDVERLWVGCDDLDSEDKFIWADGQSMTAVERTQIFSIDQPSNGGPGHFEDCLELSINYRNGLLNDVSCYSQLAYACEMNF